MFQASADWRKRINNIRLKAKNNHQFSKMAFRSAIEDLQENLLRLFKHQDQNFSVRLAIFLRDFLGSSAWISRSLARSIYAHFQDDLEVQPPSRYQLILQAIQQNRDYQAMNLSYGEIFKAIFYTQAHQKNKLELPKTDITLVLIDGILNEIHRFCAFERGARHLEAEYKIPFFVLKVSGLATSRVNSRSIAKQFAQRMQEHPHEKYWVLGFSKGGIDFLHYLKDYSKSSLPHILGLTAIASPITGSPSTENRVLNLLTKLHRLSHTHFKGIHNLDELKASLSESYRHNWFRKNQNKLPTNIAYSAIGLHSKWHESHVYMMLTKTLFQSKSPNDGVVNLENALFPENFKAINLGFMNGHHLIGTRSSTFNQEAFLESLLILYDYLGRL